MKGGQSSLCEKVEEVVPSSALRWQCGELGATSERGYPWYLLQQNYGGSINVQGKAYRGHQEIEDGHATVSCGYFGCTRVQKEKVGGAHEERTENAKWLIDLHPCRELLRNLAFECGWGGRRSNLRSVCPFQAAIPDSAIHLHLGALYNFFACFLEAAFGGARFGHLHGCHGLCASGRLAAPPTDLLYTTRVKIGPANPILPQSHAVHLEHDLRPVDTHGHPSHERGLVDPVTACEISSFHNLCFSVKPP